MQKPTNWLALGYNVPINPSKNRVYVWRKLRDLGAEYFKQGVAVLPYTKSSLKSFEQLRERILQMGGEASIITMHFLDPKDEAEMIARFRQQSESDYHRLLAESGHLFDNPQPSSSFRLVTQDEEALKKFYKRYHKLRQRDYFSSVSSFEIEKGLIELADALRSSMGDFSNQLKKILDL